MEDEQIPENVVLISKGVALKLFREKKKEWSEAEWRAQSLPEPEKIQDAKGKEHNCAYRIRANWGWQTWDRTHPADLLVSRALPLPSATDPHGIHVIVPKEKRYDEARQDIRLYEEGKLTKGTRWN